MPEEFKIKNEDVMPMKKSKKPVIIISTVIVVILALGALGYFGWKYYSGKQTQLNELKQQLENLKKESENLAGQATTQENQAGNEGQSEETADEYAGWNIYTNSEVGYQLKYPADWTVKETSEHSEILDKYVKYVTLYTPGKKYFLHWGLKYKGDNFGATDRTGLGAGDFINTGKKIAILGTEVDVVKQVYKGETQEMFFPNAGETKTSDGKYSFVNSFTYNTTHKSTDPDLAGIPEEKLAEKILISVKIIPRTAVQTGCASTLTASDKLAIKTWKTYKNDKYDYSFKYPADWTYDKVSDKLINFEGNDDVVFSWRSEEMTALGYEGWELDTTKNLKVACQSAKSTYLEQGDERMIFTQFKKDSINHMTNFGYKYIGASLSSDMVEMYDLILKSVEFSD
ncbi:MAG: hypothetical protein NT136_01195 [Candidatus Moranbacteria bacterium]|nr:hypothetical protein [Candidatus Moranbacteria bacterium]